MRLLWSLETSTELGENMNGMGATDPGVCRQDLVISFDCCKPQITLGCSFRETARFNYG